ncbi:MAG: ABC transporter substrate-binding protein [Promethearchaeota archaeon]|jgi:branched-chain amino acid transport system substrate-binding protein
MKNKNKKLFILILIISQFYLPFISTSLIFGERDTYDSTNNNLALSDTIVGGYTIPGISVSIPLSHVLKIGLLDDMGHITGDNAWKGALLAAKEINEAGGININGSIFYIGIVSEDTDEADPNLVTSKGIDAANRMINNHNPHFVTGGFRTEALLAYQEVILDAKIPFLSTGATNDIFCQNVNDFYARYKYFFRIMPLNSTSMGGELITYYLNLADYLNATYGATALKFAILREDLIWTEPWANVLQTYLPILNPGITFVSDIRFDITLQAVDMQTHLNSLQASGAQIVIPIISGQAGILMSQEYASLQPNYLLAGLNLIAQCDSYWADTAGSSDYEIVMQSVYNVSKTFKTRLFWENFVNDYGEEPYYTGIGSYDAVNLLANATSNTQSFDPDTIVAELEKINITYPYIGVAANIAFTTSHDLIEGWPYSTALFCQWISSSKTVLSTANEIYPESIPTGFLRLPSWGIQNLGPSRLPGSLTLASDADEPDTDGVFNLTWSISSGADNYSIYKSESPITYPNDGLTLVANQTAISPYQISGLKTGNHYYVLVAHNESGIKMSNSISVSVLLPAPGNFTLGSDAETPDTDGIFNLTWTASTGADNYSVYTSNSFILEINSSLELLADQNAFSPFLVSNRRTGDNYFIVVAYNETGHSLSNCILVEVQLPTPGDFSLSSDADDPDPDGTFNLIWTNSEGADNYSIYIHNNLITEINGSTTLLKDQTAISPSPISELPSGEYYFVVGANNGTGHSFSNCINITVQYPPPGDFTLTSDAENPDSNGAFNLIWTDSDGADNYSIYMHNSPISTIDGSQILLIYQTAISPFPIMGLTNGEYFFVVIAHNINGETMSNNVNITVQLPTPGDFTLSSDADDPDNDGIFYLSWTGSDGADNYSVYRYISPIVSINGSLTLLAYQTGFSPYLVYESSNGIFYYVVVAYNGTGQTMSNNILVTVNLSEKSGEAQIPGYDLMFVFGIVFIISVILIKKRKTPK